MKPRSNAIGLLWVSPWIVGFLAFMLFPAAMSLYDSFTEHGLLESPLWVGLANYQRMLHDQVFHKTLWNTLIYSAALIPLSIIAAVVLAALLNTKRLRG